MTNEPRPGKRITAMVLARGIFLSLLLLMVVANAFVKLSYAQKLDDADALVVMVNIERIRTQLQLAGESLDAGDREAAFAHAFIPHTTIFPTIKNLLKGLDNNSETPLESALTELPLKIKADQVTQGELKQEIANILRLLDDVSNQAIGPALQSDRGIGAQTVIFLLKDAGQSYQLSNAGNPDKQFSTIDYQTSAGLVSIAEQNYQKIASTLDEGRRGEIDSFFPELKKSVADKADQSTVSRWIDGIERSLSVSLSVNPGLQEEGQYAHYFSAIRTLLNDVVVQVKSGNYNKADESAVTAYLDNYEYLEAPIERHDPSLLVDKEMRDGLRQMLKDQKPAGDVQNFIDKEILVRLGESEEILKADTSSNSFATGNLDGSMPTNIEQLQSGYGSYSGERKQLGEATDSAKNVVRSSIDQIRIKLDQMLQLYEQGNYDGAYVAARSVYLDSYENIEIPLRPINPDFTLDMEIKYSELRSLIQQKAPYEEVQSKVVEIRKGLDESERLVSGTGVLAPTIAFSTSFSLVFREGLESALIIGAIVTYLDASRNQRFKKHVYYGIVIAIAATAVTWFVAEFIIQISGASTAMVEAIAGISAVAVLFWVSFWVLNKIETKKWIEFVKAKVWKATATGSVMVFVMLSFFTVYREGFETVLFYQAMLSFAKYMEWYVAAGLVSGLVVIVGVAFLVRRLGKKLPLRVLFALTMGIGAYMSIAFIGNAVREFQEVGLIETTHMIGTIPRFDINLATMTGIHPTLETIVAQLILLSVYVGGSLYVLVLRPRRAQQITSARKSVRDLAQGAEEARSRAINKDK